MKTKNTILWVLAFLITIAFAVYQRTTGPTYPMKGNGALGGSVIEYKLDRSHGGDDDSRVSIKIPDGSIEGVLYYKRYKTDDAWTMVHMNYDGDELVAYLPHQPPAGKLQYHIKLNRGNSEVRLPKYTDVVMRFKGNVPLWILIPHILLMFTAMLLSTRTGLQALLTTDKLKSLSFYTIIILFFGGLIFGPIVQKFAFGEYWTGIPFGIDLTDNKTLIAFIGWLIALIAVYKGKSPRLFVIGASVLTLLIFMIPHSALGSELDYSTGNIKQAGYFLKHISWLKV